MTRYAATTMALALGTASAMPAPQWGSWGSWGEGFPWGSPSDTPAAAPFPSVPAAPVESAPAVSMPVPAAPSNSTSAVSMPVPAAPSSAAAPVVSMPPSSANASSLVYVASGTAGTSFVASYMPTPSSEGVYSILPVFPSSAAASSVAAPASSIPAVTSAAAIAPGSGGSLPASSGTSVLSAVQTIAAGEVFDGGMVAYDRGVSCVEGEGGDSDAVFQIEDGGSLSNVIIGPNQIEGVHCYGSCTLTNVWWAAVCEDAFTIKEQEDGGVTTVTGGGAYGAEDKVLQHNGAGTMSVSGFTVDDFGKLYRSCGNCDEMPTRHVIMDDVTASSGSSLVGINSNYGDTATLTNIKVSDVGDICVTYTGNDTGEEPETNGSGPSDSCIYSVSDVTEL